MTVTEMSYWRKHCAGRDTIETAAKWVQAQAESRGLSLHDYVEGRVSLSDLGVTSKEAAKSLKPLIPCAHEYYNGWGECERKFETWEAWFSEKLRNRIFYFFHKHGPDRKIVLAWAEWPLEIPPAAFLEAAE